MKSTSTKDYAIQQYFNDIQCYNKFPVDEELRLIKLAQAGDKSALDEVVLSNIKLVATLAANFKNDKMAYLDLVQEGNIALINAVNKYDVNSNNKFSAYAGRVIKTAFRDLFDKEYRTIRLPANICRLISKINKARLEFLQENEYEANDDELMAYSKGAITKDDIETVMAYSYKEVSSDEPIFDDIDGGIYADFVSDVNDEKERDILSEALDMLPKEEYDALDHEYSVTKEYEPNEQIYSENEVSNALKHLGNILREKFHSYIKETGLEERSLSYINRCNEESGTSCFRGE